MDIIVKCIHPDPKLRCNLEDIWNSIDINDDKYIYNPAAKLNQNWFKEMKLIVYKQMTPHIISEEYEFRSILRTALNLGRLNKITRIF